MLKLQFLIGKKYNEEWSTVKNCNFSKLQFFKCNFTVISLHIFAVNRMVTHILFNLCLFEHFSPVANFGNQSLGAGVGAGAHRYASGSRCRFHLCK